MFGVAPDLCGRFRTVDGAWMLVNASQRSCFAGLQPAGAKRSGTAARRKALLDDDDDGGGDDEDDDDKTAPGHLSATRKCVN